MLERILETDKYDIALSQLTVVLALLNQSLVDQTLIVTASLRQIAVQHRLHLQVKKRIGILDIDVKPDAPAVIVSFDLLLGIEIGDVRNTP